MRLLSLTALAFALAGVWLIPSYSQEPRRGGQGRPGEGDGFRGEGRFMNPLVQVLDADRDGEISAEELAKATSALKALDRNNDGRLTAEELRPQGGREGDRGGGGGGFGGPPRAPGGPEGRPSVDIEETIARYMALDANKDGKLSKDELPERMQGLLTRADADSDGVVSKSELEKMVAAQQVPTGGRGGREGGPGGFGGPGRRGGPDGGFGGPGGVGPPNPEAFVGRAMEFDADKDGKLSKEELAKMAEQFGGRGRGGEGPGERRP